MAVSESELSTNSILAQFVTKDGSVLENKNLVLKSSNSGKSLQIMKNGNVFARGGRGHWARYFIQVVDLSQGYIRLQNARLPQHILRVNEDGHINGNGTLNEQETVFQLKMEAGHVWSLKNVCTDLYVSFTEKGKPCLNHDLIDFFEICALDARNFNGHGRAVEFIPPEASLTPEELEQFYTNGYIVCKNLIPIEILHAAIKHINQAIERGTVTNAESPPFERQALEITNLVLQSKVYNTVQSLFGSNKVNHPQGAQIALRFPLHGKNSEGPLPPRRWHIDGMGQPNGPGNFSVLCGIALSNWEQPGMGNFTVIPHTHDQIGSEIEAEGIPNWCKRNMEKETKNQFANIVQIQANLGDVILAHPYLAHRVGPNYSPFIRYATFFRFRAQNQNKNDLAKNMWYNFEGVQNAMVSH